MVSTFLFFGNGFLPASCPALLQSSSAAFSWGNTDEAALGRGTVYANKQKVGEDVGGSVRSLKARDFLLPLRGELGSGRQ